MLPIGFGTLTDASFISSNDISIKINSTISGNGTFSRLAEIAISKSVGRIAWWYNITAINSAGRRIDRDMPNIRTNLIKFASGTRT